MAARTSGASPSTPPATSAARRRSWRDNPGLLLFFIGLLLAALVGLVIVADRSTEFSPDFLSEVVLYGLLAADLTMLLALGFVLARNVIKLFVERRRALPFARFRSKLVLMLLAMTIIPALLVLLVGSELIRNAAGRWFSAPIDEVLSSARDIASDYYEERETTVSHLAAGLAERLAGAGLEPGDITALRDQVMPAVNDRRVSMVEIYRVRPGPDRRPVVEPVVDVASPDLPRTYQRAVADRLAAQVAEGLGPSTVIESLGDGSELVRAGAPVRDRNTTVGVVVVSDALGGRLAQHARRIVTAYESYKQMLVLRRPLEGVYLSFFLMMTLLILVSATWMGLYLAKRITRPIQALSAGAREIGAGHLDHRIEPETRDEFGSLVEAFNSMAGELATSQRRLERSRVDLEQKNVELEGRRRYIEAILERIATGVVSVSPEGRISTLNGAAARLLHLSQADVGRHVLEVFGRQDLAPLGVVVERALGGRGRAEPGQEVMLTLDGHELYLAVSTTPLGGGPSSGTAVVLDDVTPLIRAQKVAAWRDVARRLAHEVKNPLTPIQLCAERLKRHFSAAPPPQRQLVEECTSTIVQEVESLKQLVDEFSQFARMPAPRTVPSDVNALIEDALSLYRGLFTHVRLEPVLRRPLPPVRVDPEQFRRVMINLIDNAVEAFGDPSLARNGDGVVTIETEHDPAHGVVRVTVADNGPGVPEEDRAKLFMPYYSTKQRGSGLGLAIVRRIIVEHGGSIEAMDNTPHGTRMTIELGC